MYQVFLIVDRKLYRESIYSASTEGGIRHTFRNFDTLGVFLRQKKRFLASQAPKNKYFIARFVKGDKSFLILYMSWVILKKFSCSLFQYIVQWSFLSLMMEKYLQDKGNLLLLSENWLFLNMYGICYNSNKSLSIQQIYYWTVKQCIQCALLITILFLWELIPSTPAFSMQDTISPLNLSQIWREPLLFTAAM